MKTPEELAFEYGEQFDGKEISKNDVNIAWYAGYEAAREHAYAALEEAEAKYRRYADEIEANFKAMEAKIAKLQAK